MKFTITTSPTNIKSKDISEFGAFHYKFDDSVTIIKTSNQIVFYFGVSWPIPLADVSEKTIINQNGSWFYGIMTKSSLTVYTDMSSDYPVYYAESDHGLTVTNVFNEFNPEVFRLNVNWVLDVLNLNLFRDRYVPPVGINLVNILYKPYDTSTAIAGVQRMCHSGKLSLEDRKITVTQYVNKAKEYDDALKLPKIKNIDEYFSEKIDQNIKHIVSQNQGKPGVMSSTGVDSLTVVQALLNNNIDFNLASYCFTASDRLKAWGDNLQKYHGYLNERGIETSYDVITKEDFFNRFLPNTWKVPSFFNDLYQETYVANKLLDDCDYLIKGSNGDECFLHTQRYAMIYWSSTTDLSFDKAVEQCKQHYSYQANFLYLSNENYERIRSFNIHDVIRDTWVMKPMTYLADDQVFLDKPIYSPYCDRELSVITARMDEKDLARSILDAGHQRSYLKDLAQFLNQYKSGEEEIQEHQFPINQYAIDIFEYLVEISEKYQFKDNIKPTIDMISGHKSGDLVGYKLLKIVQLASWIKNWLD